jgi:hypothetical protein
MNRIIMIAALTLLALTSAAEARPRHRAQAPCVETGTVMRPVCMNNNFLTGVRSIKVKMKREVTARKEITPKTKRHRHKSTVLRAEEITPSFGAPSPSFTYTGRGLVERARAYMGQTAAQIGLRRSLWCSAFMRHITGASGVDDRAISWRNKPRVAAAVGSIAVMRHHVGVVSGFDRRGNPIIVSGNHGRRVGESVYPRGRIIAFVSP